MAPRSMWVRGAVVLGILIMSAEPVSAFEILGPVKKLARGMVNAATGWLELPSHVMRTTETEGSLAALSTGLVKGMWAGAHRTVLGMYEVFTCGVSNFPPQRVRDPYAPILEPEFVVFRPAKS